MDDRFDKFKEECGIFGIFGHPDASAHTALGLHALQHRGQEAAGIVSFDGDQFYSHRALGLVGDNFNSQSVIGKLPGHIAIGHNRYSTTGDTLLRNVQPLFGDFSFGGLAVAHNGNLTNAMTLRKQLIDIGCLFQSTSDTEVIVHLIALSKQNSVEDRLFDALTRVEGAYSLVVLANDTLIGVRDPYGVRPLVLGRLGDSMILASETCALDIVGAEYVRDIEPGEMVIITSDGMRSVKPFAPVQKRFCIFEYVYFSRPDSISEGKNVYEVRQRIGAQLAREAPVDADVVVPVPDSGIPGALGYAKESRIPFELGIIRNHYVGRTFIEPSDQVRHLGVKLKHNGNRAMLGGKRVILVDDSIVRGTTSKKIVTMVREAGAKEVHMRIASPPTTHSCFYGVDTPTRDQLLAAKHTVLQMAELIGVDSLAFISLNGMYRAVASINRNNTAPQFCDACFSGDYPIPLTDAENQSGKKQKDLFAGV
ncbi:MAG: amidophosphoribosyltransferase [Rickettsiales bacterium]|jgi:amidophosphoribosyltransferase|nr:amidophosphoribosyltransferase [Rickettsiales bacterium]